MLKVLQMHKWLFILKQQQRQTQSKFKEVCLSFLGLIRIILLLRLQSKYLQQQQFCVSSPSPIIPFVWLSL